MKLAKFGKLSWLQAAVTLITVCLTSIGTPQVVHAVQPDEVLSDAKLEARAREISAGLRCLVCQNQSIDDSDAPLARDLRLLVRERLQAGDNNSQVRDFIVARYGKFVLLKPPFGLDTVLLWLTPLLILAIAIVTVRTSMKRNAIRAGASSQSSLSADEQRRLDKILSEAGAGDDIRSGSSKPSKGS
jgi:cytochrome c-type biogenesis protein CcmH